MTARLRVLEGGRKCPHHTDVVAVALITVSVVLLLASIAYALGFLPVATITLADDDNPPPCIVACPDDGGTGAWGSGATL